MRNFPVNIGLKIDFGNTFISRPGSPINVYSIWFIRA